jgi:hypothetical protein
MDATSSEMLLLIGNLTTIKPILQQLDAMENKQQE